MTLKKIPLTWDLASLADEPASMEFRLQLDLLKTKLANFDEFSTAGQRSK